ncbi:MAG: CapA family protein [Clostridiales bacterium]|nr:CapA family protein [Clostridiales bacterium]
MKKRRNIRRAVILFDAALIMTISVFIIYLYNISVTPPAAAINNDAALIASPVTLSSTGLSGQSLTAPQPSIPLPAPAKTSEPPAETPEPKSAVLIFCGDILLDGSVRGRIESTGLDSVIFPEHRGPFIHADIAMANLENSVSTRGAAMEDKQYTYRADPEFLKLLTDMGIDIVSVANNHTLDFGRDAFADTLDYLTQYGIDYVGGGRDKAEAVLWRVLPAGDKTVAFLAASRVLPVVDWYAGASRSGLFSTYDPAELNEQIALACEEADYVAVYVHWGVERTDMPVQYQKDMAHGYIDAGADIVIGSHPHVLQGFEYYNGGLIAYSLGNFIFNDSKKDTAALEITINPDGGLTARVLPYEIIYRQVSPITDGERLEAMRDYLTEISFNAAIGEDYVIYQQ